MPPLSRIFSRSRSEQWRCAVIAALSVVTAVWARNTHHAVLVHPLTGLSLGLVAHAMGRALRLGGRLRAMRVHIPLWCVALALVVTACALFPGAMLASGTVAAWDAPVHTWHAHELATELFPWLRGWTFHQAQGWPEGEFYALAAYVPAVLLHKVTLGLIPIERATAIELACVIVGLPLVVVGWLGKRVGPFAAYAGGLLVLVDPGYFHQGGMVPVLVAGIWPARLSWMLALGTLWAADVFMARRDVRSLVVAMVTCAAACQVHIAGLTYEAFTIAVWLLARRWSREELRPALVLLTSWLMGALATAWIFVPFYLQKEFVTDTGEGVKLLDGLSERVVQLTHLERVWPIELAACVAGVVWLFRRDRHAARVTTVAALVAYVWLAQDLVAALAPASMTETVAHLQLSRYAALGRNLVLFAGGAFIAVCITRGLRAFFRPRRPLPEALVVCATLGLVGTAAYDKGPALYKGAALERVHNVRTVDELAAMPGLRAAAQWLRDSNPPPDTLLAADVPLRPSEPTAHIAGDLQMRTGLDVLSVSRQGTFEYREFGNSTSPLSHAQLKASGVTHLLTTGNGPGDAELLRSEPNGVRLYGFARFPGDQRVSSEKPVTIERFDRDAIVLTGPADGFEAGVRARWSLRWHAEGTDGVELTRAPFREGAWPNHLHVRVPPGVTRVVLTCGAPPGALTGGIVSLFGLLGGLLLVLGFSRAGIRRRC